MENVYTNVSRHECENERMVCMAIVRNGGSYTRKGHAVLYRRLWVVVITRLRVARCLWVLKQALKVVHEMQSTRRVRETKIV